MPKNTDINLYEVFKDEIDSFINDTEIKNVEDYDDVYSAIDMFIQKQALIMEECYDMLVDEIMDTRPLGGFPEVVKQFKNIKKAKTDIMYDIAQALKGGE